MVGPSIVISVSYNVNLRYFLAKESREHANTIRSMEAAMLNEIECCQLF